MFIMLEGPIRKSDIATTTLAGDAYYAQSLDDQSIRLALINVAEIAGITQMQDGGAWVSPINRDPAHIKPEEYYLEPEQAKALLSAIKPYVINEPTPLPDDQIAAAQAAIYTLSVEVRAQIARDEAVDNDTLVALLDAAAAFDMSDITDRMLKGEKVRTW